jgi:hypothetical protein
MDWTSVQRYYNEITPTEAAIHIRRAFPHLTSAQIKTLVSHLDTNASFLWDLNENLRPPIRARLDPSGKIVFISGDVLIFADSIADFWLQCRRMMGNEFTDRLLSDMP